MSHAVSHVVPAVIFGGLGVALLWYVPRSFLRYRRTGSIRVSIRSGWSPFGEWESLVCGLWCAARDPDEKLESTERRRAWAVYPFLGLCGLLACLLFVAGYDYLRFGHGLGN